MTTRTTLRRDLSELKQKVYNIGEKCIEISNLFTSLLESYSSNFENKLTELKNEVSKECVDLHDQCFLVLTLQQPLIKDLRFVIGSLQVVLNLEKIADYYYSLLTSSSEISTVKSNIKNEFLKLSKALEDYIKLGLTFYLSSNITNLQESNIIFSEINCSHDILYKQILNELAKDSGEKAQVEAKLLGALRALEKVADHTLNITEQVKYIIIGRESK